MEQPLQVYYFSENISNLKQQRLRIKIDHAC